MSGTETNQQPAPARSSSNWTGGRVAGLVFSSIAALVGIVILLGGLALIAAHSFARDDDGYYTTDTERLNSDTYAISTDQIDLGADPGGPAPEDLLGTLRVRAEPTSGDSIFLGIGQTSDVDRYLSGVRHAELTDFGFRNRARFDVQPGHAPRRRPAAEKFWVAQSEGSGEQRVDWEVQTGVWTVAVLNTDASRGISVEASVGVELSWLIWVGIGLAVVGLILTAAGVTLVAVIGRRASRDSQNVTS